MIEEINPDYVASAAEEMKEFLEEYKKMHELHKACKERREKLRQQNNGE